MAFDIQADGLCPHPTGERLHQGHQQEILDVTAVGSGSLSQQEVRLPLRQCQMDIPCPGCRIASLWEIEREGSRWYLGYSQPVGSFFLEQRFSRQLLQMPCPVLE